jgi:putative PIN family toxin of toxin-antitoxin system
VRIFLDANLYISYLLKPDSPSAACEVVRRALAQEFEVLTCDPLVAETRGVIRESSYLGARISQASLDILIARLDRIGLIVELVGELKSWEIGDKKDRYILDTAAQGRADVVVSGDRNLLDVRAKWPQFRILSASEFLPVWVLAKDAR